MHLAVGWSTEIADSYNFNWEDKECIWRTMRHSITLFSTDQVGQFQRSWESVTEPVEVRLAGNGLR
jgi:hypothetical protein